MKETSLTKKFEFLQDSKTIKLSKFESSDEMERSRVGLVFLDSVGEIEFVNPRAQSLLETFHIHSNDDLLNLLHNELPLQIKLDQPNQTPRRILISQEFPSGQGFESGVFSLQELGESSEKDLLEREQRLDLALEATELGVFDFDILNNTTVVNDQYLALLEFNEEEFENGLWLRLLHADDFDAVVNKWQAHLDGKTPFYEAEYRIRTKTGSWRWIQAYGKATRGKENKALRVIGTHRDITRRKQAEQELQLLYEISTLSTSLIPLKEKLEQVLNKTLEALAIPKGSIHLLDLKKNNLKLIAQQNLSPDMAEQIIALERNGNFWDWVISNGTRLTIQDFQHDARIVHYANFSSNWNTCIGFPVVAENQTLGVFTIYEDAEHWVSEWETHLLEMLCTQLGGLIEREELRNKARQTVIMEERQRFARELHDSLTQSLYSLAMLADGGRDFAELGELERVQQIFAKIEEYIQNTLKEMRLMVYELRPVALTQEGLEGALRKRLDLLESRTQMKTHLVVDLPWGLPSHVEGEIYGIVQEALNNVLKHSGASEVEVRLVQNEAWLLAEVKDNGGGFDFVKAKTQGGIGLSSMSERASSIGGELSIDSPLNRGTVVRIKVKQLHS